MPKTAKPETISLLNGWQNFTGHPLSLEERIAEGKKVRNHCPRTSHGEWASGNDRSNPVKLLVSQEKDRMENLTPIRYGRMMQSPFSFYRGAAIIMANDLSRTQKTGLNVQLCGDCHLSNFGIFATPERNIIFDLNDFDETLPGPFEWDLKRLAASFAVAAADNGFAEKVAEECVKGLARTYRMQMRKYASMSTLDIWYERIDWEDLVRKIKKPGRKQTAITNLAKLKEKRSHAAAIAKLTELVDGKRRIKENRPLIYRADPEMVDRTKTVMQIYANTLWESRQTLLQRYEFVDLAVKVVGVGSVGTLAGIILLKGEGGDDDYILLQLKQALPSVLEPYVGKSQFEHPGERIVNGQRLLQAASDMFLGWTSGTFRDFYIRQLMDVKASVLIDELDATTLAQYAEVCAAVLARAHARSGDPAMICGYLGQSDTFDKALTKFAFAYKKQNEMDYLALAAAAKRGEIKIEKV